MAEKITKLKILASGPAETAAEKSAIYSVVDKLNEKLSKTHSIILEVIMWPDDMMPGVNADPQSVINRQLEGATDIYIGILSTRLGTKTPRADSGTLEELEAALQKFRKDTASIRIFFYFKKSCPDIYSIDTEQLKKVQDFKTELPGKGVLFKEFEDTQDFVEMIEKDIFKLIVDDWQSESWAKIELAEPVKDKSGDVIEINPINNSEMNAVAEVTSDDSEDDNNKLGLFDLLGTLHEDSDSLLDTLDRLTKNLSYIGKVTTEYSVRLDPMYARLGTLVHIKGSSDYSDLISNIRKELNSLSEEYNTKSREMKADILQFKADISKLLEYNKYYLLEFDEFLGTDASNEPPQKPLEILVDTMDETMKNH